MCDRTRREVKTPPRFLPGPWKDEAAFTADWQAAGEGADRLQSYSCLCSENILKTQKPRPQQSIGIS